MFGNCSLVQRYATCTLKIILAVIWNLHGIIHSQGIIWSCHISRAWSRCGIDASNYCLIHQCVLAQ